MALEREMATYHREQERLEPSTGQYVVIKDDEVVGVFATYPKALEAGYQSAGLGSFLVKKIAYPEVPIRLFGGIRVCRD